MVFVLANIYVLFDILVLLPLIESLCYLTVDAPADFKAAYLFEWTFQFSNWNQSISICIVNHYCYFISCIWCLVSEEIVHTNGAANFHWQIARGEFALKRNFNTLHRRHKLKMFVKFWWYLRGSLRRRIIVSGFCSHHNLQIALTKFYVLYPKCHVFNCVNWVYIFVTKYSRHIFS